MLNANYINSHLSRHILVGLSLCLISLMLFMNGRSIVISQSPTSQPTPTEPILDINGFQNLIVGTTRFSEFAQELSGYGYRIYGTRTDSQYNYSVVLNDPLNDLVVLDDHSSVVAYLQVENNRVVSVKIVLLKGIGSLAGSQVWRRTDLRRTIQKLGIPSEVKISIDFEIRISFVVFLAWDNANVVQIISGGERVQDRRGDKFRLCADSSRLSSSTILWTNNDNILNALASSETKPITFRPFSYDMVENAGSLSDIATILLQEGCLTTPIRYWSQTVRVPISSPWPGYTDTPTPTDAPSTTPTSTASFTPSATDTPTNTDTFTPTPSATDTPTNTFTPAATATIPATFTTLNLQHELPRIP